MPNGGSDNCGTCWFNESNDGKPGYPKTPVLKPPRCLIRGLDVPDPFYTYCANHPHKNPGRVATPIGPVYIGDSMGNREVWKPAPDSEEARQALLELLNAIPEEPTETYPAGPSLEATVILQLCEWKEERALPGLERIARFFPRPPDPDSFFARDQQRLIELAEYAVAKIKGLPFEPTPKEVDARCHFCGEQVRVSPPAKGHLVRCAACKSVLAAGHGRVMGGWTAGQSTAFGPDEALMMPKDPPPVVLPPMDLGERARPVRCAAVTCPSCRQPLLDPEPGMLRRMVCPACDQWLDPAAIVLQGEKPVFVTVQMLCGAPRQPTVSPRPAAIRAGFLGLPVLLLGVLPWAYSPYDVTQNLLLSLAAAFLLAGLALQTIRPPSPGSRRWAAAFALPAVVLIAAAFVVFLLA